MLYWLSLALACFVLQQAHAKATTHYPTSFPTMAKDDSKFRIQILYPQHPQPSLEIQQVFSKAAARWEGIITQGFPSHVWIKPNQRICGHKFTRRIKIHDLLIVAKIKKIDGQGNVLGSAGPCMIDKLMHVRLGAMDFDSDDVKQMLRQGTLENVVKHEIGHILGLGTLWERLNLVTNAKLTAGGYEYFGPHGNMANLEVGRTGSASVENMGDSSTSRSHWKEDFYDGELMTGYAEDADVDQPLSILTIRALEDLGFQVNISKADAYTAPKVMAGRRLRKQRTRLVGCIKTNHEFLTEVESFPKPGREQEFLTKLKTRLH